MKYCSRCLYPVNHPYGLSLDAHGVCSGCRVHEEKDRLDWTLRFERLKGIVYENTRRHGNSGFDCIVPVTGGGDSYYIVHMVKNVLGMNPLLVHYNPHYNTDRGIRNLANLTTMFDCDIVTSTLTPSHVKKITRHTLRKFGSMYWHVLAGYTTFPVQVAVRYRIPLIIWGVQPWSEQTGMFSHLDEAEMTERCRKEHGLLGFDARDLIDEENGITAHDVLPFLYPYDDELEAIGVRGIYLSNYVRWDSTAQHEKMIDLYGYESAPQQRTFNTYEDVHCAHSAGLHDYLKYLKLGYGKVTDHASREIRLRRMTREQGAELVGHYSAVKPNDLDTFLTWVEMTDKDFWSCVWDRRDPNAWEKSADGEWMLKDSIANHVTGPHVDAARLPLTGRCQFQITASAEADRRNAPYLLMGRSYIDANNFGALENAPTVGGMTPRTYKAASLV